MPQVINTNIGSLNAQRNLNSSQGAMQTALQRLSSGLRVNSAKDDAAGLAIASRMESQIRGMNMAIRNANDGISLSQTAEGSLATIGANLARMRELAVQGANATANAALTPDIASIDLEYTQLAEENARVLASTKFNGTILLTGGANLTFQIGANNIPGEDQLTIQTGAIALGTSASVPPAGMVDQIGAQTALGTLDADIKAVADLRATFGAMQSRFESVINNLSIASENQSAAKSRIMDADFAAETAALTRAQILQQAGTAMLAQANQMPNNVLQLLQ
ncbi:MAG: flagellin FliC [Gallionella sp.]|jgi:flagellin|nr:flagellin FliC [Gallionella sp.]MCK9354945.1 flagellin FliC [Gallionella sp.]